MHRIALTIYAFSFAGFVIDATAARGESESAPRVSFVRDVAPILVGKCQGCHGTKTAESNYRLDTFDLLMQPGDFGLPPVTAESLDESEFHRLITSEDPDERMPNNGDRLTDREIELINAWIEQGATFDGSDRAATLRSQIPRDIPHPAPPATYATPLPITAIAFSVDGKQLLTGGYHELLVWDPATGQLTARVGNAPQRTYSMALSPDNSWLAIAGGADGVSGEVRLIPWSKEGQGGEPPKVLATGDDVFFDVAFRADGKELAAAGSDGSIRIFDVGTGAERLKVSNHADWVTDLSYSADGALIATASRDKSSKVFDAATGRMLASNSETGAPVRGATFAPDGKAVVSVGGNGARVWKVEDSTTIGELPAFQGETQAIVSHGENVFAASADRSVREFKLADRMQVRSLADHPAWVLSLAVNEPTHRLATGCFDGTVTVWNLDDGARVTQFLGVPPVAPPAQ
jgi:DNA-binding beta-propeller fold protein YncE/mono/diheme cytochrome c family protein